ncbi:MAG: hypothetical protein VX341_07480 [Bdellovibrionota bacterium]|nr:hypothetical protein [Bdellovibrionota bacterium]
MNKAFSLFVLLFFIVSCDQNDLSRQGDCDTLSMKCYRGFPRSCNEMKVRCQDKKITFTKEKCQEAFNKLILSNNLKLVKDLYSDRIIECFNEREIRKYK